MSQGAESVRGLQTLFSENFWNVKKISDKKGVARFSSELFFLSVPKKIVGEHIVFFQNFSSLEKTWKGERYHVPPSQIFVSQLQKLRGEPFNIIDKLGFRKTLCIIAGFHDFPSKNYSVTVPKNSVVEPIDFPANFYNGKILCIREGVSRFCFRSFLSHIAEQFCGQPFEVSGCLGYPKNFMHNRTVSRLAINFMSQRTERVRRRTLRFFRKFLVSTKNIMPNSRVSRRSVVLF